VAVAFSLAEIALRVYQRDFAFTNYLGQEKSLFKSAYPTQFDRELGWIPEKGKHDENAWGTTVRILKDGIRSNGDRRPGGREGRAPILAVGDSFTFGDQVSDGETWPAALERRLGRTVLNGGVFGYGLDQTFMRLMRLAEIYKPGIVVFSLFPDDIKRCELSQRMGVQKPYFSVISNNLELRNTPVPRPRLLATGWLRDALAHSLLVHTVMMRVSPAYWIKGPDWQSTKAHANGLQVARLLLQRLDEVAARHNIDEVYVLVQYADKTPPQDFGMVDYVLAGLAPSVRVVDLREDLMELSNTDPDGYQRMFERHMTGYGNEFVARVLVEAMRDGVSR
jgi:hypothetical protein